MLNAHEQESYLFIEIQQPQSEEKKLQSSV